MKRLIILGLLVALVLGTAFALLSRRRAPPTGSASVLYAGTTNVSAGSRLGNGTGEFPLFNLAELGITNIPSSGRVGLFAITNGTRQNAYFGFAGTIDVWQDGEWVERASDWPGFGWELEPGKSCVQPVPEPAGNLPWRIRLGIQAHPRGPRGAFDRATSKAANTIMFPSKPYEIVSPTIHNGRAEQPDGAANRSQPIRSETNSTSGAAGSRR